MERSIQKPDYKYVELARGFWPAQSFLARLNPEVLNALVAESVLTTFKRDEVMLREGDVSTDVYLLLKSWVKVTSRMANGKNALIALRGGGDVIGELAALDRGERSATVVAFTDETVEALRLPNDALLRILTGAPDSLLLFTESVGAKLRLSTQRRASAMSVKAEVRFARLLVELAERFGKQSYGNSIVVGVDFNEDEWGALIGDSERTIQRAKLVLREKQLIAKGKGRVTILDLAGLREFARSGAARGTSGS